MPANRNRSRGRSLTMIAILALFAVSASVPPVAAQEVPKKLLREIHQMEGLISDMLIDSPYWLVGSGGPNQGVYLPGYGVIFSLEASLTSGRWSGDGGWTILKGLGVRHRGDRVIVDWDDEDWEDDEDDDAKDDDDDAYDRWRSNRKKRDDRCFDRGKEELRETLADAADMLSQLKDEDWVVLAASLDDHRYFKRHKLHQVIMRARMSDLRARDAGTISEEQLAGRIVVEEY